MIKRMDPCPKLTPGNYYHIYNRANGSENLFMEDADYHCFLRLYQKYISPVAETLAWVLMPNHFHLLVRIKEGMYYKYAAPPKGVVFVSSPSNADSSQKKGEAVRFEDVKWETDNPSASNGPDGVNGRKAANPTKHFSHLFNAYAKYVNEKYDRHGNLFQRPFKRKLIDTEDYLRQVIIYIHNNPVHHGFVEHPKEYPWSSYLTCLSSEATKLKRDTVLDWFNGRESLGLAHQEGFDHAAFEDWLGLDKNLD